MTSLVFAIISMNTLYPHVRSLLLSHLWLFRKHVQHNSWTVAQFIHWHVWRFVHSPCLDRGQIFLGGVIFGFHHSHMASTLWQAEVGYSFLMGNLGPSSRVYGGLSGQYLDSEGLGLIQATHFNLPRTAVPGNPWVTMKCKLEQSCSSTGSCEFPGFGTSSSPSQLLIGRSSWAPSLAWGQLSFQRQVFRYAALALLVWTV